MTTTITLPFIDILAMLDESSLTDLDSSATTHLPTRKRQHDTDSVRAGELSFIPSENAVIVKSVTSGSSGKSYDTQIMLQDIQLQEEPGEGMVEMHGVDGKTYYATPGSIRDTQVQVTCSCLDFYWRFALANHGDESLLGPKPQPYIKKTNRPPVNPEQAPGVCKHLMKMSRNLVDMGILR